MPAIDPSFLTTGPEWGIGGVGGGAKAPATGGGFATSLGRQVEKLAQGQGEATRQAQALATGEAQDPSQVVLAVERAQLEMQMATTLRNKAVEAVQEIMRTQV